MINSSNFARRTRRGSAALRAIALLGAGVSATAMLAVPAAAQDYNNVAATGRVQGTNGEPIAGATVTITSDDQGFTRTVTTDNNGSFRVAALPQGNYSFSISASGFDTFNDSGVPLNQQSAANEFTLAATGTSAAAGADGEVVVIGRRQVADFSRTQVGQVINLGDLATRVPVQRDITSVVLLTPGTTAGDAGFGNLPNIRGASVAENAYYVNGLNITQFRQGLGGVPIPFDFYQTVDVKSGGFSAEFGRATGGIINATTKSGSNEFHGGVLFNWEPDELADDSPNTLTSDNDRDFRSRTDTVFQLSGPIIKDHLFFYGIYNFRDVVTEDGFTSATGGPAVFTQVGNQFNRDRNRSPFYGGKIDAVIVDGQRLEFTYFNSTATTKRQIYGTTSQGLLGGRAYNAISGDPGTYAGGVDFDSGGENYVGRYTGQFTNWLTISAAYGKNKQIATITSTTPGQSSIVDSRPGQGGVQRGNPTANNSFNYDQREFYRADADVSVNFLGSHHFRGGYDREDLTSRSGTLANGNYQITILQSTAATQGSLGIPTGTQFVRSRFFQNGGTYTSRNEAFYLQDSWQLFNDRLSLELGVRNDRFDNRNAARESFYKSGSQWAPRVGFAFDPFGDKTTKLYGNYGRYFLPIAGNTNIRLAGIETDYDRYNQFLGLAADGSPIQGAPIAVTGARACFDTGTISCRYRADGTAASTETTVSKSLKPQALDEFIGGVEKRIGKMKFNLFYTHSRLIDALEDAAVDPAVRAYCARNNIVLTNAAGTGCGDIFSGTHQYVLINPGRDATVTLDGILPGDTAPRTISLSAADLRYPKAERKYDAVTFQFDREFDGIWSLSGSYTWSKLRGNYEGGVKSDNAQTDTGLTTDFDLPGLTNGTTGFSPNDRRHNFKLFGSYAVTPWLTLGANFQAVSQRRFGCIGLVPASVDADANALYGAAGYYCNVDAAGNVIRDPAVTTGTLALTPRGSQFKSDWLTTTSLDVAIKVPSDLFQGTFRVSVINVFNEKAKLDFNEIGTTAAGTPLATYGFVNQYQAPRAVRLQLGVNF